MSDTLTRENISLSDKWTFVLDPEDVGLKKKYFSSLPDDAEVVQIPHTFNVGNGTDGYRGIAWYQTVFQVPASKRGQRFIVYFHGVYRDAEIWLNGKKAGSHTGAGFLPLEVNVSDIIKAGEENILTVRVDNCYAPHALPWYDQFDWADDGGIFRPVDLIITDALAVKYVLVDAIPDIPVYDGRKDEGPAFLKLRICLTEDVNSTEVRLRYQLLDDNRTVSEGDMQKEESIRIPNVKYWHFDMPKRYTLRILLMKQDHLLDCLEKRIGFRSFSVEGNQFILNGEKVSLVGTEWMPGSDPRIGNAERPEDIARYLKLLKDANCVYTRVHWQQDDVFYDWCDEHGMMVQEEVPLWGSPKEPVSDTIEIVKRQFQKMVEMHYDHPSIISWGVGNELNGQSEITKKYVKETVQFCHALDPYRPVNYVSNTIWESPDDATNQGDILMCNDYIGTWHQGYDQDDAIRTFRDENAGKPMLISEFGLCEPAFDGGDPRREQIFLEKLASYRKYHLNGFIYFCLNDYRTKMGEDGEGSLKRRVHGSCDLYGHPKPSYYTVSEECAPVQVMKISEQGEELLLSLRVRDNLPGYSIKGYYVMLSTTGRAPVYETLPDGKPGDEINMVIRSHGEQYEKIIIYRPTGDAVLTISH